MSIKSIAIAASTFVLSTSVNAAIVSADWQASGDNLVTRDTTNGLEWLDLTATTNRSYNDISAKFGIGGEFEGWRYATQVDVSRFFDAFGGDSSFYYIGYSTQNNGLFDVVAPFWGDTNCAALGCAAGDGYSNFITAEVISANQYNAGLIYDDVTDGLTATRDYVKLDWGVWGGSAISDDFGHALVRDVETVPVPAAVWLFGSGLLGLIGVARRKVKV